MICIDTYKKSTFSKTNFISRYISTERYGSQKKRLRMKNKKHLQTNYFKFVIERHLEDPDIDDEIERPIPDEGEDLAQKKINEIDDEIEFPDDNQTDDTDGEDDTIEQLIKEKKRLKKMYEYLRVRYGRK